jgi:hypothetical protein
LQGIKTKGLGKFLFSLGVSLKGLSRVHYPPAPLLSRTLQELLAATAKSNRFHPLPPPNCKDPTVEQILDMSPRPHLRTQLGFLSTFQSKGSIAAISGDQHWTNTAESLAEQ